MSIFRKRGLHYAKRRPTPKGSVFIAVYGSHDDVERDRPRLRRRGYYLASAVVLPNGDVRSVWTKRHEVELQGRITATL